MNFMGNLLDDEQVTDRQSGPGQKGSARAHAKKLQAQGQAAC
jgi:hypothetical protein